MEIVVLNGSPKGDISVTMQYVHYIQKQFPQHSLKIFNIAQQIRQLEQEDPTFCAIIAAVEKADGILWAFPLYYLLTCSQYKRFIELIWERNATAAFKGKYTAVLTTSIHFFDHTAHNYMHSICDDLTMNYVDHFSAEMRDLTIESSRQKLVYFAQNFFTAIENNLALLPVYKPLIASSAEYHPGSIKKPLSLQNKKIIIVTDCHSEQTNLGKMISHFQQCFTEEIEIINLPAEDIKGGCLGCLQCAYDNTCVYNDGFKDLITTKLMPADILLFAGSIKDRYLSSIWKQFYDRTFYRNHVPPFKDKQFAYIISGPLSQIANLRQIIEGYTELQNSNLVGIVTDEFSSLEIDASLQALAEKIITCASQNYIKPPTFLSIGGKKIFRDEIWGRLRFPLLPIIATIKQMTCLIFPINKRTGFSLPSCPN